MAVENPAMEVFVAGKINEPGSEWWIFHLYYIIL
jgi:hypothetical protein